MYVCVGIHACVCMKPVCVGALVYVGGGGMDACVCSLYMYGAIHTCLCIKLAYVCGYPGMCAHEACVCGGIDAYV